MAMLRAAVLAFVLLPSSATAMTAVAGHWVALVTDAGVIAVVDLESGLRKEWTPPGLSVSALAFDPGSGDAPPALVLATSETPGSSSTLFILRAESGDVLEKRSISIEPAFILPAEGVRRVYVAGRHGDRWAALCVSLDPGAPDEGPVPLPGPVMGAAMTQDGSRLLFSFEESIRSFSTLPLRSSWQLRSPGHNGALLAVRALGEFIAARGGQLAIFDPGTPPVRDPVTGTFPSDDAVRVIPLPFAAGGLGASADGRLASVLSGTGTMLAVVDPTAAALVEVREVAATDVVVFRDSADGVALVAHGGGSVTRLAIALPAPLPHATTAPIPPIDDSARSAATDTTVEPMEIPAPREETPPPPVPAVRAGPAEASTNPEAKAQPPAPAPGAPEAPSTPAISSTPATASISAAPGMIRGRVAGDVALVQAVVIYGPNSIFREFGRVVPDAGGSFSVPLPPPGRYRIALVGVGGGQMSYSPPYYQLAIAGGGIGGIDFTVSGRIPGGLRP